VALKGGKGPWADKQPENGANERVLIEDCTFGFCHSCLTCGSESIHNRNILLRNSWVEDGFNLLWLKMRPDTPQIYEYVTIERLNGKVKNFINVNPWTQFFDLKDRESIPLSYAEEICMQDCEITCKTYFNVKKDESQYRLKSFTFKNLKIKAETNGFDFEAVDGMTQENVAVELI
jgi:hypothetical protein